MCGIFGFTNFNKNELNKARKALNRLQHRGPDQWGDYYENHIYIGHRRLSILDLSRNGRQPMTSPDGKVIIAVNGEIYNYLEIKKELEFKHQFKSSSDSEVVLYGYIEWGIDELLERIDGMYSFSIFDIQKNKLFLVRDRVGIKPLYYSDFNDQISWSSELKALETLFENDTLETNFSAFYDFLTYRYIPTPKTIYQKIYKLEPGNYVKVDIQSNSYEIIQYWELKIGECGDNIEKAKMNLYKMVEKSINEQMVSDVPLGFFLSGGMDSSAVVALASKSHNDINTFTIGFNEKSHDETRFANVVAEKYQTKHHQKILDEFTTRNIFHRIKEWYDEPFGDASCFPTYLVSEYAKNNVTVVLTGDGGDEIFCGYNWYKSFDRISKRKLPLANIFRPLVKLLNRKTNIIGKISRRIDLEFYLDDMETYTRLMGGMLAEHKTYYKDMWNIPDDYDDYWYFRKYYKRELDIFTRLQYLDFNTYLHDDILTKVDRVSMAVSLECRVPLLSREIIEYMFSLPANIRLHNNQLKGLMKETFNNLLPEQIINREKKGFSIPLHNWKNIKSNHETMQEGVLKKYFAFAVCRDAVTPECQFHE